MTQRRRPSARDRFTASGPNLQDRNDADELQERVHERTAKNCTERGRILTSRCRGHGGRTGGDSSFWRREEGRYGARVEAGRGQRYIAPYSGRRGPLLAKRRRITPSA